MKHTDTTIDMKGKNKADVLAKLYNASRPLGMGFMHADSKDMATEEAQGDELDPCLYDRDNGQGAAAAALGC